MNHQKWPAKGFVSIAIGVIILIRLASVFLTGPMPQDAYYFFYSQHPALSYFDHPPAIAYLLRIFTLLLGKEVYAIKLADSILTIGTSIAVYKLSLQFFSADTSKKILILFLSTLMVSILSLVSTPDAPLLFFWTLCLISLYKAIFNGEKYQWLLSGLFMGLAFDSKYTAVFLPAGMILFLLISNANRKLLLTIWPWLACLVMVGVAAPVILWNVQNHFASFVFQGSQRMHAAAAFQLKPTFVLGLIGHQLVLLIPVALITILIAVFRIVKIHHGYWSVFSAKLTFLLCFFLPVFLVFLVLSPVYWIKINWMMPAYITGLILAGSIISEKWLKIQLIASLVIHLGLLVEFVFYPVPIKSDDTWVGWKSLSDQTTKLAKTNHADFIFSADGYKTSAELNLYSNSFIYGQNVIGEPALQFDFIGTDLTLLNGKTAVFIDSDPRFKNRIKQTDTNPSLSEYFSSVQQIEPIIIHDQGRALRKFYIYICKGYHYSRKKM